jgi:hypothetical protein
MPRPGAVIMDVDRRPDPAAFALLTPHSALGGPRPPGPGGGGCPATSEVRPGRASRAHVASTGALTSATGARVNQNK